MLRYPILQRWRYFRIKQRLLPCRWSVQAFLQPPIACGALHDAPSSAVKPAGLLQVCFLATATTQLPHMPPAANHAQPSLSRCFSHCH